ncbi:MFS transporter, partial [Klebsiella pneumoniae]|uniref:MFS transporter n=1 Tax=Klebsiella pneumoniae TaxID=573 RepID=UPI0025A23EE0
ITPSRQQLTLVATILASAMTFVDATVVNVALPALGEDLDAGLAQQQWIVLAYALTLSALFIPTGALGDRYGRRRLFLIGTAGFAVSSVAV